LPRSSTQWDSIAGSRHSLELTIAKRIGALWAKKKKDSEVYLTGTVDLGIIHGEIQIVAWKNKDILGWQLYDGKGRLQGEPGSVASPGGAAAGVVPRNGRFLVFP